MKQFSMMFWGAVAIVITSYFTFAYGFQNTTDKLIVAFGIGFMWLYSFSKRN